MTNEEYVREARNQYAEDGEIEIDDGATVSRSSDRGAYVQAWVWVEDEDLPEDAGSEDDPDAPGHMKEIYYVDLAMCGGEFEGDVRDVAAYLSDHGWPSEAVTSSHNGAPRNAQEPPEALWLDAIAFAEGRASEDDEEGT